MAVRFSTEEREAIRQAVSDAEGMTSGEIVPYVIGQSGAYHEAALRGAILGAVFGAIAIYVLRLAFGGWGGTWLFGEGPLLGMIAIGSVAGYLKTRWMPFVARMMAGPGMLTDTVHRRAMAAFLDEEVFKTRERTGILIFVSLMERRIEVIGDSGINERAASEDWIEVIELARQGIRDRRITDGLVAAITRCGEILREKGVDIRPDDTNELSDRLRLNPED